ncbi:hypothetical protein [Williamsia herbipolensis]|uniref:hypothetical protein n=1 Tax=Williamsia herbipolensis TaxID=1603258 RepID=UPI0005F787BA|nr:hypothetical protein [Williamsia herbipolensis]
MTITEPTVDPALLERMATSFHEAGHALVGRVLGVSTGVTRIKRAELVAAGDASGHAGRCTFGITADGYGQAPLSATWAGPLAEERFLRGPSMSLSHVRDALADHLDDRAVIQARDYALDGGAELDDARASVEVLWPFITDLATRIEANGFADDGDVRAVLALPATGDVTAELQQLRRTVLGLFG